MDDSREFLEAGSDPISADTVIRPVSLFPKDVVVERRSEGFVFSFWDMVVLSRPLTPNFFSFLSLNTDVTCLSMLAAINGLDCGYFWRKL